MTENVNKQDIENDELICPITLQLFRDPVKAKDGHVYERNAITRWIIQHGTSPLTREPLNINDLQPDEHIKSLARQRRNSSVSYNSHDDKVTISSLQYVLRNTSQVTPQLLNNQILLNIQRRDYSNKILILIILFSFILPISFIIAIVVGLNNSYSQDVEITSTYSSSLTANNSYNRSVNNDYYYYRTFQIKITRQGFYGFQILSKSSVSINGNLYFNYFNDTNLSYNLLSYTYNDKDSINTYFGNWIQPENYILMITTYPCCSEGSFNISVTGPDNIYFP